MEDEDTIEVAVDEVRGSGCPICDAMGTRKGNLFLFFVWVVLPLFLVALIMFY